MTPFSVSKAILWQMQQKRLKVEKEKAHSPWKLKQSMKLQLPQQGLCHAAGDCHVLIPWQCLKTQWKSDLNKHTEHDMHRNSHPSLRMIPSAPVLPCRWRRSPGRPLAALGNRTSKHCTNPSADRYQNAHSFPNPNKRPTYCPAPRKHTEHNMHSGSSQFSRTSGWRPASPAHLDRLMPTQSETEDSQTQSRHTNPSFDCQRRMGHILRGPRKLLAACPL